VDLFTALLADLHARSCRFVVIGVWGVNYYASGGGTSFRTQDRDLFLPLDAENLVAAWASCEAAGLELFAAREPLDQPRDLWLGRRVVERRALTQATDGADLRVDLALTMAGLDFESVWRERRTFDVHGVSVPVARLRHIVESKAAAGREKDRLFLATHAEALRELLGESFSWERPSS
jgi:hypothetical protein